MRIGLDARTIYAPQRRGIGKSLLRLYQTLQLVRPDWEVVAYHRASDPPPLFADGFLRPRCIEMPGDRLDAWQRVRLPMAARLDGVDLLHCPANACPAWTPVPVAATIHDLIPIDHPDTVSPLALRRFERGVRGACRRAAAITCPSIYTMRRLIRDMHVEPGRIHLTPWGADARAGAPDPQRLAELADRYRVSQPFVVHFGAADPRKNTRRLLEAWALLGRTARRRWRLLVLGLDAAAQAALLDYCRDLGIHDSVALHGFALEEDVPDLLAAAGVLAYPSRSEGFGLPILEAFAARTPVLAGNRTSLPEVAGDAAELIDPDDPVAIAHGLGRLLRDGPLRDDLAGRGARRLAQYSWTACAQRFARALESVADTRARRCAA